MRRVNGDMRAQAVAPTRTAPTTAKALRQASDGTPICASPSVAWYPAMVAGTAIEERDHRADERRADRSEYDLSGDEGSAASEDGDNDGADRHRSRCGRRRTLRSRRKERKR